MNKVDDNRHYGDYLFAGIETLKHSRFSHYVVKNEAILEMNSLKATYLKLREIKNDLDELKRLERQDRLIKYVLYAILAVLGLISGLLFL